MKYWALTQLFFKPVDAAALSTRSDAEKIKQPMDLGTMTKKLYGNVYQTASMFKEDVKLVFLLKTAVKESPFAIVVSCLKQSTKTFSKRSKSGLQAVSQRFWGRSC